MYLEMARIAHAHLSDRALIHAILIRHRVAEIWERNDRFGIVRHEYQAIQDELARLTGARRCRGLLIRKRKILRGQTARERAMRRRLYKAWFFAEHSMRYFQQMPTIPHLATTRLGGDHVWLQV